MADDDWAPAAPSALAQAMSHARAAAPEGTGVQVPGYSGLVEVARGGDSIVYRARQLSVDRDVAIKVMQTDEDADVARFERELAITVRLGRQHPHIVTVLDTTTTTAGQPCLVMEFHDLGSLHDPLRESGPLPISDAVAAGTAVADALAFAHAHGVLHRDVKPQNVLVLPTSYVLSDFGIARMIDAGHTATLERFSYRHASPQVLDGLTPTEADDLWSLGSTLSTLLDGRAPFASLEPDDDTALSYLRRVRLGQRRPLARADVPAELAEFVDACLTPDRDGRPASAGEALRWLRGIRTEDRSWAPGDAIAGAAPPPSRSEDGSPGLGETRRRPAPPPAEPVSPTEAGWAPAATAGAPPSPTAPPSDPPAHREPEVAEAALEAGAGTQSPELAPSVLAHVAQQRPRPVAQDGDHTGLMPDQEQEGLAPARTSEPGEGSSRGVSGLRRALAFFVGALMVGIAIGAGALVIERMSADDTPTQPVQPSTIPVSEGPVPTTGPVDVEVSDPALAPVDPVIVDGGTSVQLSWGAPQQEVGFYVVLQILDEESAPVAVSDMLPALVTQATIEGLDPDGVACFAVMGLSLDMGERGVSEPVCRTPLG